MTRGKLLRILDATPLPHALLHLALKRCKGRLFILNYHYMPGPAMRRQLRFLRRQLHFVSPDGFERHWRQGAVAEAHNLALLTFDDGYQSFYTDVYPVLRELDVPALVFLPAALIGTDQLIWTDYLKAVLVEDGRRGLPPRERKRRLHDYRDISVRLKRVDDAGRRRIIERLRRQVADGDGRRHRLLTWRQVREMAGRLVGFGSHSSTHPILSTLPPAELRAEIEGSRRILEHRLAKRVTTFAYPNGKRADYTPQAIRMLQASGYRFAFTTLPGAMDLAGDPYQIRRLLFFAKDSLIELALKLLIKGTKR